MARGQPDFGALAPTETIVGISDLGELAVRLGSIVTFDRRGNVIFLENFDGSLSKVLTYTSGTGGSISISNEKSRWGDFSCKMVTGNHAGDYAKVDKYLAYPSLSKFGIEMCWHLPTNHNITLITLAMWLYDGTKYWKAVVVWDYLTSTWYYLGSDNSYVALSPTVAYYEGSTLFYHTKLVADFVNKEYMRFLSNDLLYDLTGKALRSLGSSSNPFLLIQYMAEAEEAGCGTVYLDGIIITQNEP